MSAIPSDTGKNLKNIEPFFVHVGLKNPEKLSVFFTKSSAIFKKTFFFDTKLKKIFLWILPRDVKQKTTCHFVYFVFATS